MLRLVSCLCVGFIAAAHAAPPPPLPRHRVDYTKFFVVRLNPLGIQDVFDIGYRYRLYDSEEPLWRTGQVGVSFNPIVTPAMAKIGISAEIEPIAVLRLQARWEWQQYWSAFGHLQSYPKVDGADWSDSGIKAGKEAEKEYSAGGWQAMLLAELRAKVSMIIIRSRLSAFYSDMNLNDGDTVWYDPFHDLLTPGKGWSLTNEADVIASLLDDSLLVGVRHSLAHAFYPDQAFATDDHDVDDFPIQRVGPLVAWHVYDRPGASLSRVTVIALLQWYLSHPFRTGQDTNQGIPYVAIGCAINGELWRAD